jgi:hypothetical protein
MKARKVKGLDPEGSLSENALRIVATRLGELRSFSEAVRDPAAVTELHDMRIAAKRLRYVLEMTEGALGPAAAEAVKAAKELQDVLGDIHDCDEFAPRVQEHIDRLRAEDAAAARAAAGTGDDDLDPAAAVRAMGNRRRYRGLDVLHGYLTARRGVLYERFLREWHELENGALSEDLPERLRDVRVG